jgi:hypothetical protein
MIDPEQIEMVLDSADLPWTRRDNGWAVTADGAVRELLVGPHEGGLQVDAILVEWEDAAPEALAALGCFLERAEPQLHGARCRIEGTQARLLAEVSAAEMESGLPHALQAVSFGCRSLAREARALLEVDLARQYLMFHETIPV